MACLFALALLALLPSYLAGVLLGTSLIARDRSPKRWRSYANVAKSGSAGLPYGV